MGVPLLQGERAGVAAVARVVRMGVHHEVVLTVVLVVVGPVGMAVKMHG